MKITLDTEQDVLNYISFLQQSNQLLDKVGTIELSQEEATNFFQFNVTAAVPTVAKPTTHKLKWTSKEDAGLLKAIENNLSPATIATELSRTESSVRSRSINHHRIGYTNNKWHRLERKL